MSVGIQPYYKWGDCEGDDGHDCENMKIKWNNLLCNDVVGAKPWAERTTENNAPMCIAKGMSKIGISVVNIGSRC